MADYHGDSLGLSQWAATTDADVIVFCGVHFMAETAKILNPNKTVLLPASRAGCSLAESITADDVRWLREQYPGVPVVTYINTYADVKAESDICVTSGNAADVVKSLDSDSPALHTGNTLREAAQVLLSVKLTTSSFSMRGIESSTCLR